MAKQQSAELDELFRRFNEFKPDPANPHDAPLCEATRLALESAAEGNFGVGAVLIDLEGNILERGRNRVFVPHFRGGQHAERDVLDRREARLKGDYKVHQEEILYTTLEPCIMCAPHTVLAGVLQVRYGSADPGGGDQMRLTLASDFTAILEGRIRRTQEKLGRGAGFFVQAECSKELQKLDWDIFSYTRSNNAMLDGFDN